MSRLIRTARTATLLLVAILCGAAAAAPPEKVDLNSAPLAEVAGLPIPEELARNIVEYRTYVRYFGSIYDLMEVEGMTPAHLAAIKPLAATIPPSAVDADMARLAASYRQVRNYLGQEGANEALADEYLDMLREPVNVNELDLFDLQSFQNVSPVDAKSILQARKRLGAFESDRQLRRADGLRYFSFRNLRDFVVYRDDELGGDDKVRGSYQLRFYDTPYAADEYEIENFVAGQTDLNGDPLKLHDIFEGAPSMTHKLSLNLPRGLRAGAMTHRALGEEEWDQTRKGYVGLDDKKLGPLHLKRLYVGNYRVAFGQGLVMDNSDYIQYRRTGFGFNKRPVGVRGDLSRSHEYALTGLAAEAKLGRLHGTVFASWDKKDGIVNTDGTLNSYVTMDPRPSDAWLDAHSAFLAGFAYPTGALPDTVSGLRRNAIEEDILGGNMKLMLGDATYVGVTAYEARYNRGFRADVSTLVAQANINNGLLEARDSEMSAAYTSVEEGADGSLIEHKFRRVYGAEFQTVVDNVSFQGEYATLQDPTAGFLKGERHDALVLNGFAQWDNLHLLAIWRDYDVGFDNPYNRGFGNDNRYEQTLLDSPFRLNDSYYSWLSLNTPQPKPEKGLFLQTRYRVSRNLIINGLEYDRWSREADGMDMTRYTLKVEYQPKFNLRLRMRHRYSSRGEANSYDVRWFRSWESRFELITLLSNYNRLKFMYMTSNVWFPPRQRLSGAVDPVGTPAVGTAAMPAHALQVAYEHNLSDGLRLLLSSEVYDGFLWNFEGNEFVVVDGRGFRNWFKVESRVSDQLLFQLKVTRDHNLPRTYLDVRSFGEPFGEDIESSFAPRDITSYRLQMDYTF